ncbi:hypothetical protein L6251_03370 [Candidatus Parcubacteria bacterium]|nr:hypothetical protein [Candidatus Parcubacteria bacterium]
MAIFKKKLVFGLTLLVVLFSCGNIFLSAEEVDPSAVANRRAQLQEELKNIEAQIETQRSVIQQKQKEATTLERDIAIFDAKIAKAKLEIKMRDIEIAQLSDGISNRSASIKSLSVKIDDKRNSIAELLRNTNEIDSISLIEIFLGNETLSDFFVEPDSYELIQRSLQDSLAEFRDTKNQTEKEKEELENKKAEQVAMKGIQEIERNRLTQAETEKKRILKITKGEESKYQKVLSESQKSAAAIRTQLFLLTGSPSIPFEKAVEYANIASSATGIRPAFLLGVIAEESNLGANIGTGNWKTDMHPTRDAPIFKEITAKLGLDPDKMPVSKKAWYGWGGAMGPAQFIPSTWIMYESKIAALTGHNPPNPWDPYDAFMASAILLTENGAVAGNLASERLAALRYLAGWKNAGKSAYAFYGDDVMELAAKYQSQIDILKQ